MLRLSCAFGMASEKILSILPSSCRCTGRIRMVGMGSVIAARPLVQQQHRQHRMDRLQNRRDCLGAKRAPVKSDSLVGSPAFLVHCSISAWPSADVLNYDARRCEANMGRFALSA